MLVFVLKYLKGKVPKHRTIVGEQKLLEHPNLIRRTKAGEVFNNMMIDDIVDDSIVTTVELTLRLEPSPHQLMTTIEVTTICML